MATRLEKPIHRDCLVRGDWVARGRYIVSLIPMEGHGTIISFRQKGKKKVYSTTLKNVLELAIRQK